MAVKKNPTKANPAATEKKRAALTKKTVRSRNEIQESDAEDKQVKPKRKRIPATGDTVRRIAKTPHHPSKPKQLQTPDSPAADAEIDQSFVLPPEQWPIDNGFWFNLSRTWVTNTDDRVQAQATNIQSTIKWVFGLGTSGTIIGIFLKNPHLDAVNLILFGLVLLFLMMAFALSILATSTTSKSIAVPNDPVSIRRAFNHSSDESKRFLLFSSISMFLGMVLIAPALILIFNAPPEILLSGSIVTDTMQPDPAMTVNPKTKKTMNGPAKPREKAATTLKSFQVSGSVGTVQTLILSLDSGKSLADAKSFLSMKFPIKHKDFDFVYSLNKETIIPPGDHIYLTIYYSAVADTSLAKSILLKPVN